MATRKLKRRKQLKRKNSENSQDADSRRGCYPMRVDYGVSLYLALFEKLRPIDVDEFKEKVRYEDFLPPLFLDETSAGPRLEAPVILCGNFLEDALNLDANFDLVIGNPPWDSRGDKQIGLHFANRSAKFLRGGGVGCLLLPSTILVNRHGTLDGMWFRAVTVQRIVQLADFRRLLFKATHPCFIIRYTKRRRNWTTESSMKLRN